MLVPPTAVQASAESVQFIFVYPSGDVARDELLEQLQNKVEALSAELRDATGSLSETATRLLHKWGGRQCEGFAEDLAAEEPQELARLIGLRRIVESELGFAAEFLGRSDDSELVRRALKDLLNHVSPGVREGAIYGLADHRDTDIDRLLYRRVETDPTEGVRAAAAAVLAQGR